MSEHQQNVSAETQQPDSLFSVEKLFGFTSSLKVTGFAEPNQYVPKIDPGYCFDKETTLAILAGFMHNRRVLLQGYHGTGKSTHIEQVAARLNWPCVRVNLDSNISRIDLIGKDAIVIKDNKQITKFIAGILPWAMQRPVAICFDEYDAGRPDIMFVIQRVLEEDGKLTLLDQAEIISPHPQFRLFATANTVGLGDDSGLYHGTNPINQGQMDRWHIVATLNYLPEVKECAIILAKCPELNNPRGQKLIKLMVKMAEFSRNSFANGDLSTVMSPRTVLTWAQNYSIFDDIVTAFKYSFFNRCDPIERSILAEEFQRCFGQDIVPVDTAAINKPLSNAS